MLSLSLFWLSSFLAVSGSYSTICLENCRCGANIIECNNLRNANASFLYRIRPSLFPDLQYLLINGAEFLDLPNKNIFGQGVHRNLHFVNFTDCRITSIGDNSFSGMPYVKFLYLDKNPLSEVHSDSFSSLSSLESLDLSYVFDADRQNNLDVLKNVFKAKFPLLQNIYLRGNNLRDDVTALLCDLPRLFTVDLSSNRLSTVQTRDNCTAPLKKLNIAYNDFSTIPTFPFHLDQLDVHGNPLNCIDIIDQVRSLQFVLERIIWHGHSLSDLLHNIDKDTTLIKSLLGVVGVILLGIIIFAVKTCSSRPVNTNKTQYSLLQMQEAAVNGVDFV